MHEILPNAFVIDSPGIKNFGLIDMAPEELKDFFPEIFEASEACKFHNCLHLDEPVCAVIEAVQSGRIAESRYQNYFVLYNELKEDEDRDPARK